MIVVGNKYTGKKLVNAIVRGLQTDEHVSVAALSDRGVQQINNAGQKASNRMGVKIHAMPSESSVTIDGIERVALVVELTVVNE